jgi:hypothetical protein
LVLLIVLTFERVPTTLHNQLTAFAGVMNMRPDRVIPYALKAWYKVEGKTFQQLGCDSEWRKRNLANTDEMTDEEVAAVMEETEARMAAIMEDIAEGRYVRK